MMRTAYPRHRQFYLLAGVLLLAAGLAATTPRMSAAAEAVSSAGLPDLIASVRHISDPGERVIALSERFLGTPYRAGTLGGGPGLPEVLTINLQEVDCFTFLDYLEALRRSTAQADFRRNVIHVRYRDSRVAWQARRHFFTDWIDLQGIRDVTAAVGGDAVRRVEKTLNRKADGNLLLPGVAVRRRSLACIPGRAITPAVAARLRPGDYVGLCSEDDWLDVTHVGVLVRRGDRYDLRHASSRAGMRRVIDTPLRDILQDVPGIIVLRPQAL